MYEEEWFLWIKEVPDVFCSHQQLCQGQWFEDSSGLWSFRTVQLNMVCWWSSEFGRWKDSLSCAYLNRKHTTVKFGQNLLSERCSDLKGYTTHVRGLRFIDRKAKYLWIIVCNPYWEGVTTLGSLGFEEITINSNFAFLNYFCKVGCVESIYKSKMEVTRKPGKEAYQKLWQSHLRMNERENYELKKSTVPRHIGK